MPNAYRERIYRLARQIPKGRVMTYGQLAEILSSDAHSYTPQTVGWAWRHRWARVINSKGGCSTGKVMLPGNKQQFILESEDVVFDATSITNIPVRFCTKCCVPVVPGRVARGSFYCSDNCRDVDKKQRRQWKADRFCRLCGKQKTKRTLSRRW